MPFRASDFLTREANDDLRDALNNDPRARLAGFATLAVVSVVGVATYLHASEHVERPWLLALLLVVAVSPCVAQCFTVLSAALLAVWALVPLGLLNLAGHPLGVYDRGGREQMSILIIVWVAGEIAAIGRQRDVIAVAIASFAIAVGRVFVDPPYSGGVVIWTAAVAIAMLAGLFIRALVVALVNAKIAEGALREQATTEERQRIAREVHDVIAHSMTVTMLHLTAARMAVARGDSVAATEALEEAEKAGRTSLNEIRNTVGLLRTDTAQPNTAPLPSATDVPALVAGYAAAGINVDLDVRGDLALVEPAAGLALYRIVQESLTNAGRHAPGARCVVRIDAGPPLRVDVDSLGGAEPAPTPERGDGLGLTGMAERAAALGGRLEAGRHGSGWRVAATIP